ncbi:MAG: flagellar filament capping protein FliD [Gammaproteobacteria bacterium SHHR-1]|uniref:flagellar filament capping protein FliD n=1 Tax=Magnetovirga frankeli TaxID=947516 RepID=UPI001293D534|nr:flagellar filament capping protein FliD [gamma proteobacterium SS-5]
MASIGSLGVGTGIDLNSLLSQLMEIERRPLYALQDKEKSIQSQISDYGSLKSSVSSFRSSVDRLKYESDFNAFKASSSEDGVFSPSVSGVATAGSYDIEVTQLAKSHKLASQRFAEDQTLASGSLTLSVGDKSMSLTVDETNNTLAGLRDAINKSEDNPGVTATIINEGGGSRLMLSSNETGAENAIVITDQATTLGGMFDTTNDLDGDEGNNVDGQAEVVTTAQDAQFSVDSFQVTSASNSVEDVVQGITLNLATVGSAKLTVTQDLDKSTDLVQGMVDAYNKMRDKIESLQAGNLKGDSTLRQIDSMFITEMTKSADLNGLQNLFEVGVTRTKEGRLSFDKDVYKTALEEKGDQVVSLFTDAEQGFAERLSGVANDMLSYDGMFAVRNEGLDNRLQYLKSSQERMERRLEETEDRLVKKFTALDTTMSRLNSTSSYLSSQFY